jgi:hypothetical protein
VETEEQPFDRLRANGVAIRFEAISL